MFLNLNMWNNSIFINVHGFIILFWCNLFTMLREAVCFSCLWLNRDSGWNYYSLIIHCTVWWGATGCIPRTVMLQWASLFAMILMIYNTCANLSFIGFFVFVFLGAGQWYIFLFGELDTQQYALFEENILLYT